MGNSQVKGFVFAAGLGQRLQPLTDEIPKPLLPIGRLPLAGFALKLLARHGITDVIVNTHHLQAKLRAGLGDGADFGVSISYSIEEELLGTGGGLKRAVDALGPEPVVVVNGDTLIDVDLDAMLAFHKEKKAVATMAVRKAPNQESYSSLDLDPEGRIVGLLGAGPGAPKSQKRMFAGVHILEARFLAYLPPDIQTCINGYGYTKALQNGEVVGGFECTGAWADVGTPARYWAANRAALDRTLPLPHADPLEGYAISPRRDVAEVVRMGENVHLGAGVHLLPPVLLGDGVRIGDNAVVGPYAILSDQVTVGKDARVENSVVFTGTRIDAGAQIQGALMHKRTCVAVPEAALGAPSAEATQAAESEPESEEVEEKPGEA